MKKPAITLVLIIVLLSIFFYNQIGKTNNVQVRIGDSTKFSEQEINEAIDVVKKEFKNFKGCELTDLWYSEEESNKFLTGYLNNGRGTLNGVTEENIIVLTSNFDVDSSGGDGSFEPNSTQSDWKWVLIRDSNTDPWRVDDWGY